MEIKMAQSLHLNFSVFSKLNLYIGISILIDKKYHVNLKNSDLNLLSMNFNLKNSDF